MRLFRSLITGGELTDLERALGDGLRVFRRRALADVSSARQRSVLVSLALNDHPLHHIQVHTTFYDTIWRRSDLMSQDQKH